MIADAKTKVYGDADPSLTYQVSGLKNGDTAGAVLNGGITKALLNVIADAKTKVYGDADPALTYQVSGLKRGDTAGAQAPGLGFQLAAGAQGGLEVLHAFLVEGVDLGDVHVQRPWSWRRRSHSAAPW